MLTNTSFFAGIGGFDLGFERVGITCRAQIEIDPYCQKVLARHYPSVDRSIKDIHDANGDTIPETDVFTGGFPCQDVSVAGRRKGLDGSRSGLWFEFHRAIADVLPRWIVIENVPGLLSSNSGRDFAIVIGGLTGILPDVPAQGWGNAGFARGPIYSVAYRVFDSQYFGVAQRRRRVFIVGYLGDGRAANVLFERTSSAWDSAPERAAGKAAPTLFASGAGTSRTASAGSEAEFCVPYRMQAFGQYTPDDKSSTLKQRDSKDSTDLVVSTINARNSRSNGAVSGTLQAKKSGGYSLNYINPIAFSESASTLCKESGPPRNTSDAVGRQAVQPGLGVRRLTPTECERLQGFPDGHTAWGINDAGEREDMSDSRRYKMLGNAVTVNVAEWIGQRIVAVETAELRHNND